VLHIPEGLGRLALFGVAAVVFLVLAFGPGNLWGKGGTLSCFAVLPLLVLLQDYEMPGWLQMLLGFLLLCVFVIGRTVSTAPHLLSSRETPPSLPHTPPALQKPWHAKRSN
jgi:hypothetical protein